MKVTFRQAEGITLVELQGLMDFNPRDPDTLKQIEADIDRHLEAGARAFLIDMQKVKFGYTAGIGKFLEVWAPVLKSRRARVAFLLARRTERKPVFRRLLERVGLVSANEFTGGAAFGWSPRVSSPDIMLEAGGCGSGANSRLELIADYYILFPRETAPSIYPPRIPESSLSDPRISEDKPPRFRSGSVQPR